MENVSDLIKWILKCDDFEIEGACELALNIPSYEITPKDFLKYAEIDLQENSTKGKVGVISNLKRALDSQLDIFFETINVKQIFIKNNLKFERKTQFLSDIGMLPNKSINKLNTIRNRMEHQFTIPTIEDLEVYYELVWNVIEIVNLNLQLMTMGEVDALVTIAGDKYYLSDRYDIQNKSILFKIYNDKINYRIVVPLLNQADYSDFTKAFKVFRYIIEMNNFMDLNHFMQLLSEIV